MLYPQAESADNQAKVDEMRAAWEEDVHSVRAEPDYDGLTNHERNLRFISIHWRRQGVNEESLKLLAKRRKIVHRAVRPCEQPYDKRYFTQNLDAYQNKVWQPGHVDHEIHVGKIHDLDQEFPNSQVIYQMSDVHYYLSGWKPKNTKKDDYYICVGANFPVALPGHYVLPFNEGTFWIDHKSMLHM